MDKKLSTIIDDYWTDYVKNKNKEFVVKPSIPIIWFGDMEAYKKSSLKVVTVAINPSLMEFCEKNGDEYSFLRFKGAEVFYKNDILSDAEKNELYKILNNYYIDNPYVSWFKCLERPLNYLGASYHYDDNPAKNTAIHIDIKSANATNPTWGELIRMAGEGAYDKKDIESLANIPLFNELLEYLAPDVILYSSDAPTLKRVFGCTKENAEINAMEEGKTAVFIRTYTKKVGNKTTLLISGRNFHGTPFGGLSKEFMEENFANIISDDRYKEILK